MATCCSTYDSSTLRDDGRAAASRNADYLKRWTSVRITVEGHADTRGTSEYNLALGERRAAAVKDYIVSLGVPADRITTVSKGKEQPVCTEENEACWQRNRRGFHISDSKVRVRRVVGFVGRVGFVGMHPRTSRPCDPRHPRRRFEHLRQFLLRTLCISPPSLPSISSTGISRP